MKCTDHIGAVIILNHFLKVINRYFLFLFFCVSVFTNPINK